MPLINQAVLLSQLLPSPPPSHSLMLPHLCSFNRPRPTVNLNTSICICRAFATGHVEAATRRSANYQPNLWDYNNMQSLTNGFDEKKYEGEAEKMKEDVKVLIEADPVNPLAKLELIDTIQRLGLQYQFDAEIKHALKTIDKRADHYRFSGDLYATSLRFRLLRQHGYNVPQDVFKCFLDDAGNFRESLPDDIEGLLNLYEASFHGLNGETIIDKAMEFSSTYLKAMEKDKLPKRLARKVDHALDMPIHWRPNRLEARWFIDMYEEEPGMNPTLLKLAKLDYNLVQSTYIKEVRELSGWWVDLAANKMSFFRDRLLEHYLWAATVVYEPKYEASRMITTKIASMTTTIDDVYDVYGLPEELELLTDFIDRWDITGINKLPHTISACFLTLYNTTNEIGHRFMMERGINIIPYLRKAWSNQCNAYLVEAKWYHKGLKPPLKEYLNTATISISGQMMLLCHFLATTDILAEETVDLIFEMPRIMLTSSMIFRLTNDLGTSTERVIYVWHEFLEETFDLCGFLQHELARGDNLKSVECYMNETGETEEAAREHIKDLVRETWKTMNEDLSDHSSLSRTFLDSCANLARASQCFYQYGDGHGIPDRETKEHVLTMLIQPVPMD